MSYWSDDIDGCDYAFGSIGASISWITDRLFKDGDNVIAKRYPEQAIVASLCCLRVLGERFPKSLSVHFGRREFDSARKKFDDWYALVHGDLPAERSRVVKLSAEREFALFEQRIFHNMTDG